MTSSWFNWGFSLIFSAVLAKEVARRVEGVDYRALAAASFLGLGSIWAQGLSGSAALQMASPGALQPQIREIVAAGGIVPGGIIPFRDTIFLWQSFVSVIVEIAVVTAVMWLVTPPAGRGKTARDLGIELGKTEIEPPAQLVRPTPGQWLEHSAHSQLAHRPHRRHVSRPLLHGRAGAVERDHAQHRQLHLPAARFPSAQNTRAAHAGRPKRDAGGLGRDPAVSHSTPASPPSLPPRISASRSRTRLSAFRIQRRSPPLSRPTPRSLASLFHRAARSG